MTTKNELSEQIQQIQARYQEVVGKLDLDGKKKEQAVLATQMQAPDFWEDQNKAQKVSQKAAHLEKFIKVWQEIEQTITDLSDLIAISTEEDTADIKTELNTLERTFNSAETELLLSGPYDAHNALLSLHVGNGGQDAEDFCQILERMYLRFAETQGFKTKILEESTSDAGIKSAMIRIKGPLAYGFLKSEHGVHRLIRLSPFNAKSLRQTSFAKIEVLPEIEDQTELDIAESDLRVDVFRSSGAGGQSVNTTDSAVRITYLPLNLVVTCQNEKSQHQNKEAAMKVLKSRLLQLKLEQQAERLEELRGDKMDANFGSQIRTYTLQPYKMVKDHRTEYEVSNPEKVFDGEIMGFVGAFLRN